MDFVYYTYNSDGIRTKKYEYNGNDMYSYTHNYVLDGSKILKETILYSSAFNGNSTTTLEYYYDESGVASFRYNGTVYHYIKNLQGDVIGIVNSNNGGIVVEYTYDAWGNILSITGELASTVGQINPFRYRGYYYDNETGLYYLNSRYYDPQVGRFINADGIVGANGGLQGYNMLAYCNNNPMMYVDPNGYAVYKLANTAYVSSPLHVEPLKGVGGVASASESFSVGSGTVIASNVYADEGYFASIGANNYTLSISNDITLLFVNTGKQIVIKRSSKNVSINTTASPNTYLIVFDGAHSRSLIYLSYYPNGSVTSTYSGDFVQRFLGPHDGFSTDDAFEEFCLASPDMVETVSKAVSGINFWSDDLPNLEYKN